MITKDYEKARTEAKNGIKNENPFRIFENEKFGKIEVLFKDDQFYFPAIEIAEILGYRNPRDAVKRHCVNEFPYVVFHDVGINTGLAVQTIQKKYINEGNLYRLIAKSKLPEAREFERWIFDTVIPSIRKYGYYSNVPQIDERDRAKLAVVNAATEEERMIAFGIYQEKFVIPMEKELEIARPKVESYNEFLEVEGTSNTTTIAKSFGLPSGRALNEIMHFEGFVVKIGSGWGPAKKYVDAGIMKSIEFSYNNQKSQSKSIEKSTNENKNVSENNEVLLIEENKITKNAETVELVFIENKNEVSNIHQKKGLTFRWTLTGIEAIKEILLSKNYIIKNGNIYSANNETLKEFKKKYKEWKEIKKEGVFALLFLLLISCFGIFNIFNRCIIFNFSR